uniref:Uncharacterized protein n=1 Tax=Caenorhabditis tropicalis TaxID=1561998 RepID=A0A1I7UPB0_9PELO
MGINWTNERCRRWGDGIATKRWRCSDDREISDQEEATTTKEGSVTRMQQKDRKQFQKGKIRYIPEIQRSESEIGILQAGYSGARIPEPKRQVRRRNNEWMWRTWKRD